MKGKEPDCIKCVPPLWEENKVAFKVWFMCHGQELIGPMGGQELNFSSVFAYMDRVGIEKEQQPYCLELVYAVYQKIKKIQEQQHKKEKDGKKFLGD